MEKELKRLNNELNDIEQRVENVLKASQQLSKSTQESQSSTAGNESSNDENCAAQQSSTSSSSASSELDEIFKSRVNEFLKNARDHCKEQEENFSKCKSKFQKLSVTFCMKPRPGESEVTPEYFFSLWLTFGFHFKDAWKRETQKLAKQRLKHVNDKRNQLKSQNSETKPVEKKSIVRAYKNSLFYQPFN